MINVEDFLRWNAEAVQDDKMRELTGATCWYITSPVMELRTAVYRFENQGFWCERKYTWGIDTNWAELAARMREDFDWIRRAFNTVIGMKNAGVKL